MKITFPPLYLLLSKTMEKYAIDLMRIALAIVYIWFGALKILGISPAADLVARTVFWFKPEFFIPILGVFELIIGLGLFVKRMIPVTITVLLFHMITTIIPFFILQSTCFKVFPFEPTLEGQYIIKNLVLISGALIIAGKYNEAYYAEMNLKKEERKANPKPAIENNFLTY